MDQPEEEHSNMELVFQTTGRKENHIHSKKEVLLGQF